MLSHVAAAVAEDNCLPEEVSATMRIHIFEGTDLAAKDLNGFSDPYVKVTVGGHTFATKVVNKSLNPVWNASYDFDVETQSLPDNIGLVLWDKDLLSKDDFMGLVNIRFSESSLWADGVPRHFDDPENQPQWHELAPRPGQKASKVSGAVRIKVGFIDTALSPAHSNSRIECARVWAALVAGGNRLGLGQRKIRNPANNTDMSMSDIPMVNSEADPNLGHSDVKPESEKLVPGTNNLHGLVFMEVISATDLPRLHNATHTGFDMDPFVIISFGKYIFRTRVIRHSLAPVWNAKLIFRVHHGEESFKVKFSVHDWDKLSGNDHIGATEVQINDFIQVAGTRDDALSITSTTDPDMHNYNLSIDLAKGLKVASESPQLQIRSKFVPYTTLRRRFWFSLAKSYEKDNQSKLYNKILIQTMLEGLGSTLSTKTIDGFFAPFNKNPEGPGLTFDELFERLERQVKVDDRLLPEQAVKKRWFKRSSQVAPTHNPLDANGKDDQEDEEEDHEDSELYQHLARNRLPHESNPEAVEMAEPTEADFDAHLSEGEHMIRISTCPICHDTSLGNKLETDVVTHIAVCSGNDGFNLDKLILGDFVTEANAQRKWINKIVKSLGYGRYSSTKSNANIIIQDRVTGQMLEEKMPTFIRLGIRLLYKSPAQKINVGKILADMSTRQGVKFNDPRSRRDIEPFIRFHGLEKQMEEVLEPIQSFRNFNEFFYRKLKMDARTLASPGDDRVAVSVADCRMTCFQTISDATHYWIKGRQFTLSRLLGNDELSKKYEGGSLAIFRLAPQDYHRFHIPVRGVLSEPQPIAGEYFTVNPMAIRSQLDVYGENKRTVSTIESKEFGSVAYVAIGAMMVGSIVLTTQGGQQVERMDEHGYFAFGGSTIVLLFEPNTIQFDEDLVRSSKGQVEMLVKVGMKIGVSTTRT